MARHNRAGEGVDQAGFRYEISYQPDWLSRIKVTRRLPNGRRSTKILFRNPASGPVEAPPNQVRIGIASPEQDLELESTFGPGLERTRSVTLEVRPPDGADPIQGRIAFTLVPFRPS